MRYTSIEQVIEAAQKSGSEAKTFKGAAKYLAKLRPALPLEKRGERNWRRTKRRDYEHEKRGSRILMALNLMTYPEAEAFAGKLSAPLLRKAEVAIKGLCNAGYYRRSRSSWAGGIHSVECTLSREVRATGGSERAWSDNGKWTGTNSHILIDVKWELLLQFPPLILPDTDFIVIDAAPTECSNVLQVVVLEQGRGFTVKPVTMWYVPGKWLYSSLKQASRDAGANDAA